MEKTKKVRLQSPHLLTEPGVWHDELTIDVYMNQGGLGDMIARMPAIYYFLNRNTHCRLNLWVPHFFMELAQLLLRTYPADRVAVKPIGRYKHERRVKDIYLDFTVTQHSNLATNLTRHAFNVLCDVEVDDRYHNYPKLLPAERHPAVPPGPYVVVCSEYTSEARQMPYKTFKAVVQHITSRGFRVVLVGKTEFEISYDERMMSRSADLGRITDIMPDVVDLRNKTPHICDALEILGHAHSVIGIDNGLIHLAAMTDVPIIAAYTSVSPRYREIRRNGQLWWKIAVLDQPMSLSCRYCQSHVTSMLNHTWINCLYTTHPEHKYQCTREVTAERLIRTWDKVVELEKVGQPWASPAIYTQDMTPLGPPPPLPITKSEFVQDSSESEEKSLDDRSPSIK